MKFSPWSPVLRIPLFVILFLIGYFLSSYFWIISSKSNTNLVIFVLKEVGRGEFGTVGNAQFAYALACMIVSAGFGIAFAMLFTNVLAIRFAIWRALLVLDQFKTPKDFKDNFDRINQQLKRGSLIGHPWEEFEKTCIRDQIIRRTMRPHSFLNVAVARERVFGMKLMPTIPGYFVGLGLLLTFVGLVIALSKAAGGVSGSPDSMRQSLRELLDAATFKFSTSIAGLFSSLALAFIFKSYAVIIENGFDGLCRAIEKRTVFIAPQAIMLELVQAERDQLQQLKEINDVQFFDRLGKTIGPAIASAVERAVEPLTTKLGATVDSLEASSRNGVEGLLSTFTDAVQGSAGTELRELSVVLGQTREALGAVQANLSGSGDIFAKQMADATLNFAKLVSDSGQHLSSANDTSRATLDGLLQALTGHADLAKERMNKDVADAGSAASSALTEGLDRVLRQVASQMEGFKEAITSFQDRIGRGAEAATLNARQANEAASAAAGRAAAETAEAIRSGFAETIAQLRADIEKMSAALRSSEAAFSDQARASRSTVEQTQVAADAFGRVAQEVASASRPLLQSSERMASSTDVMAKAVLSASDSFQQGQSMAAALAGRLEDLFRSSETAWRTYEERFGEVDAALSRAVETLASKTEIQQKNVADFVAQIDQGCAAAVQQLHSIVNSLEQNTSELNDAFSEILSKAPRLSLVSSS